MDIQLKDLVLTKKKNFILMSSNGKNIEFEIDNVLIPFGVEKYESKFILNVEVDVNNNENHNIITKIENAEVLMKTIDSTNAEFNISQSLRGKGFMSSLKDGLKGKLIRCHFRSPEIYILKKDGNKIYVQESNLKGTICKIKITVSGIWENMNNFGSFININDIQIKKL